MHHIDKTNWLTDQPQSQLARARQIISNGDIAFNAKMGVFNVKGTTGMLTVIVTCNLNAWSKFTGEF